LEAIWRIDATCFGRHTELECRTHLTVEIDRASPWRPFGVSGNSSGTLSANARAPDEVYASI
jgi:hypothetical protein